MAVFSAVHEWQDDIRSEIVHRIRSVLKPFLPSDPGDFLKFMKASSSVVSGIAALSILNGEGSYWPKTLDLCVRRGDVEVFIELSKYAYDCLRRHG